MVIESFKVTRGLTVLEDIVKGKKADAEVVLDWFVQRLVLYKVVCLFLKGTVFLLQLLLVFFVLLGVVLFVFKTAEETKLLTQFAKDTVLKGFDFPK